MRRGPAAFALFSAALSAAPLFAQERAEGPRARPREEVFRLVDDYIAKSLQERLALSDDQASRALPLVRRLHADRRQFAERRMRALQQMRRASRAGTINDARAGELVRELRAAEAAEAESVRAARDAVDAVLTPVQQLKYRIFEGEIEHRLRELMARVRSQRRDGLRRRRGDGRPDGESPAPR